MPGLIGLLAVAPLFALSSAPDRKLWAASAPIAGLVVFAVACLLAGIPNVQSSQLARAFPLVGAVAVLALIAPSTLALRWRWLGLLHLLTLAASAYLWFIASLAISHDAT